ncbi:MAG TPA: PAS domain S-box protein [Candidatus Limnocylindria bacterium]|nr:PAS domain S-box protein [Candidatus Limnocylindria bacterium]
MTSLNFSRPKVIRVFMLAASLLLASLLVTYFVGEHALASHRRIAAIRSLLSHLEVFISTLKDAETGQRGYLLTGDERFLEPYRRSLATAHDEMATLRAAAASGELPAERVDAMVQLAEEKLEELGKTVQMRQDGEGDRALARVRSGFGRLVMDKIRVEVGGLATAKEAELRAALNYAESAVTIRTLTFIGTSVLNLAFLGWACRRITREMVIRETAELENVRQKELLATSLSSIGDGVILTDVNGGITFLNPEAERLTGWKSAEASGKYLPEVFRIINETSREAVENPVEKVLRLGTTVGLANHTILISRGGGETAIDDSAAPIRQPGGPLFGVVLVFRDFTAQRKAEEDRTRLAAIVEFSSDAIFSENLEGVIQTWNAGAERMFGYSAAETIGKSTSLLIPEECRVDEAQLMEKIRTGQPLIQFETVRLAKGSRRIPVMINVSPHRDHDGQIVGASEILHDITEILAARQTLARGKEELEGLVEERTTRLTEMVTELQQLSYAITHDMRAPLRAMSMFAQLLIEKSLNGNRPKDELNYCRRILTGANRLDLLIRDALNYSQAVLRELPLEPIDLSGLLHGLIETYPNLNPDVADITIEGRVPWVFGNESLLTECFSNLLGNAVKFVAPGVRPKVRVWGEVSEEWARIWIQDNGIGIDPRAHPRLFGMFQKLESGYEGTGIGLAIVRKVVERMGGKVGVESVPEQGSRFWVELRICPTDTRS